MVISQLLLVSSQLGSKNHYCYNFPTKTKPRRSARSCNLLLPQSCYFSTLSPATPSPSSLKCILSTCTNKKVEPIAAELIKLQTIAAHLLPVCKFCVQILLAGELKSTNPLHTHSKSFPDDLHSVQCFRN